MMFSGIALCVVLGVLALSGYVAHLLIKGATSFSDGAKLVAPLLVLPMFLVLVIYDKIAKQTAGIILTAVISFAVGQAVSGGGGGANGPKPTEAAANRAATTDGG